MTDEKDLQQLQADLDILVAMGHVEAKEQDGETVYRITEAGMRAYQLLFETDVEPTNFNDLNLLLN